MNDSRLDQHVSHLIAQADRCVKCGLCLPHCPTYALTRDESESPRGRIALADALARGTLVPDDKLLGHLDRCLLCRSCERVCPSAVPFAELMDDARALTVARRPRWPSWLANVLSRRRLARLGMALGRRLPTGWVPLDPALQRAADRLARGRDPVAIPKPPTAPTAPTIPAAPRVGLFLGCVGDAVQPGIAKAARRLLEAAGAAVVTPAAQTCCGALHSHLGDLSGGARRADRNLRAFQDRALDAIVSLASGCGTQLAEQSPPLPATHWDVTHYLLDSGLLERLRFAPLDALALVHTPCTLTANPSAAQAVGRALAHIPGLRIQALTAGAACCGAGGMQLLTQPAQGKALRAAKLDAIRATKPDFLLTSNIGCALHLSAGLDDPDLVALHPIELLARQLKSDTTDASGSKAT